MTPQQARDLISIFHGAPTSVISDCLRGFLIADDEHYLMGCDFSAIEARVLAWLAGQENVLEIFRTHGKIYEAAAADIYLKPMDKISKSERQLGKVAVLALGYQGGVGALQMMAKGYGVLMAPLYSGLWASASETRKEKAEQAWSRDKKKSELSREEYIASDLTKQGWREGNQDIVRYWYHLEEAACSAITRAGSKISVGPKGREVIFLVKGSFLFCRLPSSRVLSYPYPKLESFETPWGAKKDGVTYMSEDVSKRFTRHKAYGGLFAENITQAVARDVLAEAMIRLEARGWPVVMHVHDEIVCEVSDRMFAPVSEMEKIMCELPPWAKDLPIAAEGWRGKRYRK